MHTADATLPDIPALLARLRGLVARGQAAAARPLLSAVARIAPPSVELWQLEAEAARRDGDPAAARAILDRAVAAAPDAVPLLLARARLLLAGGDPAGAAADAALAVLGAPGDAESAALLGLALLKLDRPLDAVSCLSEAVFAAPGDVFARAALAGAEADAGRPDAAAATIAAAIAQAPADPALRTQAMLLEIARHRFAAAIALGDQARRDGAADACVLGLLGHALSSLDRHAEAAQAYESALHLAPADPYVRHLAAAGGRIADAGRAPPEYVRVLFDGYAGHFDAHLIGLGYRIPGLARAALTGAAGGPVLDLGCGTGLMAVALSDLPLTPWIGVDLSPRMLEGAAARGRYAELHQADLPAFLAAESRRFPLILAGDVLPYFGDLRPLFAAIAARLAPGGRFLCSAESGTARWQLGPRGRYAHAAAHLAQAADAAGLRMHGLRAEDIRCEAGAPVPGLFAECRA